MATGGKKRRSYAAWYLFLLLAGLFLLPQTVFGALTAQVTNESTVRLDWAGTGKSPYILSRNGIQIYSGTGTSYEDVRLGYSLGYDYTLSYQNYEKVGGGYTSSSSYWGVVTPGYSYQTEEWKVVTPGHWEVKDKTIPWCSGTSASGIRYEHSPPCSESTNETTKTVKERSWVDDIYGWVRVTHYVDPEYGWVYYDYWVPEQYDYVTRTTTVKSGPLQGTTPSVTILSPTANQWFADSMVARISVTDLDGEPLVGSYFIDNEATPRESKNVSNTSTPQQVAFSQINLGGLTEGVHTLKVSVTDNHNAPVVQTVIFHIDKTGPVIGNVQSAATDSKITVTGVSTDQGAGLSDTPYRFKIGTVQSPWVAGAYTFHSLSADTAYPIIVEARDMLGHVTLSEQVVYTMSQVPSVQIIQSTESSLKTKVSDSNAPGTRYQIKAGTQYVDADGNLAASPVTITLTNKEISIKGLQAGRAYSVQAAAVNQAGLAGEWSEPAIGVTIADPPEDISTLRTQTSITLSWPAAAEVTRYEVEADGMIVSNGTAVSYTHSSLIANTNHTYRVRVVNTGGTGRWSSELQMTTLPNPPTVPTGIEQTYEQNYVTLSWDPAARAEFYEVEADGVELDAGSDTTYTHSGLQSDSPHVYRIRAVNIGGNSEWSEPISIVTWPDPPPVPENIAADPLINHVTVTWSVAERATEYEIEADGFIVSTGDLTSYKHEGLLPVTGHTYRVRAVNIGGKSPWSLPVDITTHPEAPSPPTRLLASADKNEIAITWYKVPYTDSYEVMIDGAEIVNVTDNEFTHTDLSAASRHTYKVRARNISGDSDWSSPIAIAVLPSGQISEPSLTNIAAIVTNRFITISWDAAAPDAEYDIEVDGVLMDNGRDTIFNHTGLGADELHTYRIRFKDRDEASDWVAALSLSTLSDLPDAPIRLEAYPDIDSIELYWERVEGATGYDIEIDGRTTSVEDAAYLHEGLDPGTLHTYRVRAKNDTGLTAWSPAIVKSTHTPDYLISGIRGEEFVLSLYAYNVQDFSEMTNVITYDPNEMEVVDLYQYTPEKELSGGKIAGTPLDATYEPGRITFKVNRNIVPGTSWSGETAAVVFRSKVTGQLTVRAVLE
ncbi:fibronectin type III domain-containing protein [Cohnella cellulosilytica]|uniref:Fibronectin type III domain-containing protein n=1 Tax=Cohnella cellulosilytica TaxID=986710 RepID=A0ABW2FHE4_9BACL